MDTTRRWLAAGLLLLPALAGCASRQFGPRTVVPAQRGYNEAIGQAVDQQLLLNLVRLRHHENPLFLEFASIVAQFNRNATVGASLKVVGGSGLDEGTVSASAGASESPVLTLVPVKGREFVQRMLSPIQPESLVALVHSGWSISRLLRCCVLEVAELRADTAQFLELALALGEIHRAGGVELASGTQDAVQFDLARLTEGALPAERHTVERLLGLTPGQRRFRLTVSRPDMQPGDVTYVGRTFYGILQFLARGVEEPAARERLARDSALPEAISPTDARDPRRAAGLFVVHTGPTRLANATLAVSYRGRWFWIADDDRESKATFSLLSLLTSLKSSETTAQAPVLAIGR